MKEPVTENFEDNTSALQNNKALHFWLISLLIAGELLTVFNQSLAYGLHSLNQNLSVVDYLHLVTAISMALLFSAVILIGIFGFMKWFSETLIALYSLIASVLVIPAIGWTLIVLGLSGG